MLRDYFRKQEDPGKDFSGDWGESAENGHSSEEPESAGEKKTGFFYKKPRVPDGMFRKCVSCGKMVYEEDVRDAFFCCPECGKHFRIDPRTRIRFVTDRNSFEEWDEELAGGTPLDFPEYEEKRKRLQESTGLKEAVITGAAKIAGQRIAIGAMSPDFLMGSMGTAVGEKITRMIERATEERLPVILFCCSGGARMQEGIFSLMQMAKTSQALKRHDEAGLLYVSVLTDPTTGGVTASFAMLGDVILAEPGALIGFAGARVIRQTIGGRLPEGFQSAEFLQKHGFVDRIVRREQMRRTLAVILKSSVVAVDADQDAKSLRAAVTDQSATSLQAAEVADQDAKNSESVAATDQDAKSLQTAEVTDQDAKSLQEAVADQDVKSLQAAVTDQDAKSLWAAVDTDQDAKSLQVTVTDQDAKKSPWERVLTARDSSRPYSSDYINHIFDGFMELHGDRLCGDDRAVIGGIAAIGKQYVTVIGQQKGRNTKENRIRNFGMMNPEGYRKALRLMKQAEKFRRPILLFVDTPGAFCGVEAEERGQGEAIARNLFEMAGMTVPILSVVIGEGGSGGALALAMANEVWMLENSVYSVLSPEGFAAILWKDGKRAPQAAEVMKLTAEELKSSGIIEKVIPERTPADKDDMEELAIVLRKEIEIFLKRYREKSPGKISDERYQRFRKIGAPDD